MRVLSVEKKHPKSGVKTIFYLNLITSISGLSSEIIPMHLCSSRDCKTAKCQSWKAEKNYATCSPALCPGFFFVPPTLPPFLVALQPLSYKDA